MSKDKRSSETPRGKDKAPSKTQGGKDKASERSRPAVKTMKGILHSQKHRTN